jgi:ribosome-associated protein
MSRAIVVTESVHVPERALTVRAVRASGPGGQNVNKVASKVDLRVDLDAIEGLSDAARERLRMLAGRRLDAQGHLVVVSQATRDQFRNLEVARERVRELVSAALREPRPRRPTRPSAAAGEARLTGKKRRAVVKRWRARPGGED